MIPPPPCDVSLERVLLGLILRDPVLLDQPDVGEVLFDGVNARTFLAFRALYASGASFDLLSASDVVRPFSARAGSLVMDLHAEAEPHIASSVLRGLKRLAQRRLYWRAARTLDDLAQDNTPGGQPEMIAALVDQLGDGLQLTRTKQPRVAPIIVGDYLERVMQRGHARGVGSGLVLLDHILGGFRPGDLVVLAARTSVGKSALALQIAGQVAHAGTSVLYVSPEMAEHQIAERLASTASGVPLLRVRAGSYTGNELSRLEMVASGMPPALAVWDESGITSGDVAILVRQHHAQFGLGLLVIDHLGFLADRLERGESRTNLLGRITKAIKALGRRLGLPVLLLHQLNRDSERGATMQEPSLSDLRDSGCIEEDADAVLLLHRETRDATEADLIVAKNRQGPTGSVPLTFALDTTRFTPRFPEDT